MENIRKSSGKKNEMCTLKLYVSIMIIQYGINLIIKQTMYIHDPI